MALSSGIPAELVTAALLNPDIRKRGERIIEQLFAQVEYDLKFGTADQKRRLMNTVMPSILKGVQGAQQDEENARVRAEYQELRGMLMGLGAKPPE